MKPNSALFSSRCAVRVCTLDDLPALAAIEVASHPDPWSESLLTDAIEGENKHTVAAIEAPATIKGFCCYQTILDESELHNLAVMPVYRREGIASLLLENLFERLAVLAIRRLFLEVRESNGPAVGLYLKMGFTQQSVRPGYYRDGETALVMVRKLSPG